MTPSPAGVGNCYVFKSRLQEYAQKIGISTPVYQTVKEGPSHKPLFRSTVIVNNVSYESLPGFFNHKAAEQSAAEVALMEIEKTGQRAENIPVIHESGLCKNMLQEYAQKMNYAIPSYNCKKQEEGSQPFICTVEIGGIQYIGAAARTKKEAEIKAARTALLAIKYGSEAKANGASQYTVLPVEKKGRQQEPQPKSKEHLKTRRVQMKEKQTRKKNLRNKGKKAPHPDSNKHVNMIVEDEGALVAPNKDDMQQGPGGKEDEPQSQTHEPTTLAMAINRNCSDEEQGPGTTLPIERVQESQDGMTLNSAAAQEEKVGDASSANGKE